MRTALRVVLLVSVVAAWRVEGVARAALPLPVLISPPTFEIEGRAEFSAGAISADGGTNINNSATYPCWSGTAGSIWWLRGRGLGTFIMVR